ncbi:B12-binding domain-containing radical SAM protein [Flexibacterium corallicola]|uniref:B12-binding domain-containing radical SAM protein n=1 Tax=Flexibacterium corallicola TaxID=3037259 RepID=UPI00286EE3A5|nr:radical SAM protein [Pseudovibrio sp. M1P-2-3]
MQQVFNLYLVRPTRYDEDGYPVHWIRTSIPANSLACIYGISQDCQARQVLGPDVSIRIHCRDEGHVRIRPKKIIEEIQASGTDALVCFVGVQTNQFPRAMDLARPLREAGVQVAIGGFHVTGCMVMLDEMPEEMVEAKALGISMFLGEAEDGRFDQVLRDAYCGTLKEVYDFARELPHLPGQPRPQVDPMVIKKSTLGYSSFDLGRGCPFECSFCCIINVQGRSSRFRSPEDLEKIIRDNKAQDITKFFITDDNFARNRNWEAFLDCLIGLRENEGFEFTLIIQVDTLCHKIPKFIEKCVRAGVDQVFVGLENINSDNLALSNKRQNKITDYREMFLAWKKYPVVITAGYIIGFPGDTRQSILNDIDIIKQELAIDVLSLSILTPLHGSVDHKNAVARGDPLNPDLNLYDLTHAVFPHPNFEPGELDKVYREAWLRFYTKDHCIRILKRAAALGSDKKMTTANRLLLYGEAARLQNIYSLDNGFFRLKYRQDRRPGLPLENVLWFHLKFWPRAIATAMWISFRRWRYERLTSRMWKDPKRFDYKDVAISRTGETEYNKLELFTKTRGGIQAVQKAQKIKSLTQRGKSRKISDITT